MAVEVLRGVVVSQSRIRVVQIAMGKTPVSGISDLPEPVAARLCL